MLMAALLVFGAQPGYADHNVPPWPTAGPDGQTVPPGPVLKPLPPEGLPRAPAPEDLGNIISDPVVDMRALVLHKSGDDAGGVYNMIEAYLEILGIPYDVIDAGLPAPNGSLEESDLWDGVNHGHYQAIFITTSDVWATYLDAAERSLIEAYERAFGVRQVTLYVFPNAVEYGINFVNVAPLPLDAMLSSAGQVVFDYLRSDATVSFSEYGYQAQPASGVDFTTLFWDTMGNTLLGVFRPADGREHMVVTMSSYYPATPPASIHARLLPYGMINWAMGGVFLGERHLYFVPQPDDVLGWGDRWDPVNHTYIYDIGYRNEPADLDNLVTWMAAFKTSEPNAAEMRIEMPFNAEESFEGSPPEVDSGGTPVPGTLTAKAVELEGQFTWLNHTYSHADLDSATLATCTNEISRNNAAAATLGFSDYSLATLLTGDYSGMGRTSPPTTPNQNLADAAYALGVRYMLVNESDPLFKNPSPNAGIPHPLKPAILEVPRYANNIFYAASTPEQETDLYNWIYCNGYQTNPDPANRCYDYAYIIDSVSNQALGFMLDFSINPTMFHMNNLDNYGDGDTLMTDFIEALYAKYNAYYDDDVPVLSLRTQNIGERMWDRMSYDASGARGELRCGGEVTLMADNAAPVPVTGVSYGSAVETYAGQPISTIDVAAGATVVIPGEPARVAAAISDLSAERSGDDVLLTWTPTSVDTQGAPLSALVYYVYGHPTDANFSPGPTTLLGEAAAPPFTHLGAGNDPATFTYLVTAIGDNCWKRESAESNRVTSRPLAVMLASLTAAALEDAVLVQWETASEVDNLGFNLYRGPAATGPWTQLNAALIPSAAPGSGMGYSYDFLDRAVTAGFAYYYLLESIDLVGTAQQHGPIEVYFSGTPTAVGLASLSAQPAGGAHGGVAVAAMALASLTLAAIGRRRQR